LLIDESTWGSPKLDLRDQLDKQRRLVDVDHFDVTIRELIRMAADKELVIAPEYQRKFRWTTGDESRLVESLFLGLPVPSLFVATNADGTWEVVDGLQRLSTLIHFVADPAILLDTIKKPQPLRLSELEKLPSFNEKTFEELPTPLQLTFSKRSLRVTALSDKSDVHVRFDLFERLNTGGVSLTAQEVRACIIRGTFNDLLRELADIAAFRSLLKLQESRREDGTREELVLKFFAYLNDRKKYRGAVRDFLTDYMESASEAFDYERGGRSLFVEVVTKLQEFCHGQPFVRPGYATTPLNQFEAAMVGMGELLRENRAPVAPRPDWVSDEEFMDASGAGSNTLPKLNARIARAKALLSGKA
jgi:hypothetical protein